MTVADSIGIAAGVVAIGTAIIAAARYFSGVYQRTLGSRQALSETMQKIGPGVTISYVDSLLGLPTYVRSHPVKKTFYAADYSSEPQAWHEEARSTHERIYFTRHAYIQVIGSKDNQVVGFCVTSIDEAFRPTLRQQWTAETYYGQRPLTVRIGDRFSVIPLKSPRPCFCSKGYGRESYVEILPGTQAATPDIILAYNNVGASEMPTFDDIDKAFRAFWEGRATPEELARIQEFRAKAVINTVGAFRWSDNRSGEFAKTLRGWSAGIDFTATPALLPPRVSLRHRLFRRLRTWWTVGHSE